MRKNVLFIVLTSVMMSLCVPASAQLERSDSTVNLTVLTADMLEKVKAYVPSAKIIAKNEYIIEIGSPKKNQSKMIPTRIRPVECP